MSEYIEKMRGIQIMKSSKPSKGGGKTFYKPPNPEKGELGLIVPSGGILEQKEVDEIAGEALEKMAREKRQPTTTRQVHMEQRGNEVIIEDR